MKASLRQNVVILASGEGTNAENIIRYFQNNKVVKIAAVLCNNPLAGVLARAEALHVPARVIPNDDWTKGEALCRLMKEYEADLIVLAGFLKHIPAEVTAAFPRRIINIHPSLLPRFGGKGMYGERVHRAVIEAGEKESGITIHYVNEHYDEGHIILQAHCPVLPQDTPHTLAQRIHSLEHAYYPVCIETILKNI